MPSDEKNRKRSAEGLAADVAGDAPEATISTSVVAPTSAGMSQRTQRFMNAPLPGFAYRSETSNDEPIPHHGCGGNWTALLKSRVLGAYEAHALVHPLERGR